MYYSGTATNYSDLLDKLITNATASGNDWVLVEDERNTAGKLWVILKGIGNAGDEAIYVGIQKYFNVATDTYGLRLQGMTGFNSGVNFHSQPGAINFDNSSNFIPTVPLWNDSIAYEFAINRRRISCVAKVGTVYEAFYLGFLLPYSTKGQQPYPLVVGGSAIGDVRYDNTSAHTHYVIPYNIGTTGSLRIRDKNGTWRSPQILTSGINVYQNAGTYPFAELIANNQGWSNQIATPNSTGDIWLLKPVEVFDTSNADNFRGNRYGVLDGIFHIPGLSNAAENTVTVASDTYTVYKNVFRSNPSEFWAFKRA